MINEKSTNAKYQSFILIIVLIVKFVGKSQTHLCLLPCPWTNPVASSEPRSNAWGTVRFAVTGVSGHAVE